MKAIRRLVDDVGAVGLEVFGYHFHGLTSRDGVDVDGGGRGYAVALWDRATAAMLIPSDLMARADEGRRRDVGWRTPARD